MESVTMESVVLDRYREALRLAQVFHSEGMHDSAERYEFLAGALDGILSVYESTNNVSPLC